MARIVRSPTSQNDIEEIAHYISKDNPSAADRWIDRLDVLLNDLAETPGMGRERGEFLPGLRSYPFGNYLVFYRKRSDGVEIVRVVHGARNLKRMFKGME